MNTGGVFQSTPTSTANNRLTLTGTTYDPAGNLTRLSMGGETFEHEYDGLSMMRSLVSNTDQAKVFLYNADDERFAVFECVSGFGPSTCASGEQRTLWYMRDLGGKVDSPRFTMGVGGCSSMVSSRNPPSVLVAISPSRPRTERSPCTNTTS